MKLLGISDGKHTRRGVSLVEILVVISLGGILVTATIPIYSDLHVGAQVGESTSQFIQTLRTARERSNARLHGREHGIYIEQTATTDSYILYEGASYADRESVYDRIVTLDEALNVTTSLPGNEVHFAGGTGVPNATGTITFTHVTEGTKTIHINDIGMIEEY